MHIFKFSAFLAFLTFYFALALPAGPIHGPPVIERGDVITHGQRHMKRLVLRTNLPGGGIDAITLVSHTENPKDPRATRMELLRKSEQPNKSLDRLWVIPRVHTLTSTDLHDWEVLEAGYVDEPSVDILEHSLACEGPPTANIGDLISGSLPHFKGVVPMIVVGYKMDSRDYLVVRFGYSTKGRPESTVFGNLEARISQLQGRFPTVKPLHTFSMIQFHKMISKNVISEEELNRAEISKLPTNITPYLSFPLPDYRSQALPSRLLHPPSQVPSHAIFINSFPEGTAPSSSSGGLTHPSVQNPPLIHDIRPNLPFHLSDPRSPTAQIQSPSLLQFSTGGSELPSPPSFLPSRPPSRAPPPPPPKSFPKEAVPSSSSGGLAHPPVQSPPGLPPFVYGIKPSDTQGRFQEGDTIEGPIPHTDDRGPMIVLNPDQSNMRVAIYTDIDATNTYDVSQAVSDPPARYLVLEEVNPLLVDGVVIPVSNFHKTSVKVKLTGVELIKEAIRLEKKMRRSRKRKRP